MAVTDYREEPAVTDTTHAEDAPDLFIEHNGARLAEDDFGHVRSAYGHISAEAFSAAVASYERELYGQALSAVSQGEVTVQHVWAVIKHSEPSPEDEGWYFTWDGVTEDTEGAFPMTVGPAS